MLLMLSASWSNARTATMQMMNRVRSNEREYRASWIVETAMGAGHVKSQKENQAGVLVLVVMVTTAAVCYAPGLLVSPKSVIANAN